MSAQQISTVTHKELVAPMNPAATDRPIVSGSATTKDPLEMSTFSVEEPPTLVEEVVYDGVGGYLAIEGKRGLVKAFGGDTIVTLSDGTRHVIPAEVKAVWVPPDPPVVLSASKKEKDEKK